MKRFLRNALLLMAVGSVFFSCKQQPSEEEAMKQQAVTLHEEALAIYADMKPIRERIPELREQAKDKILALEKEGGDSLRVQKLIEASNALKMQQENLKEWLDNLVEPATEHNHAEHDHSHDHAEHDHDHADHDHDQEHSEEADITAAQMLEIQEEMKRNILSLQDSLQEQVKEVEQLLEGAA